MQRAQHTILEQVRLKSLQLGLLVLVALGAVSAVAQPVNDNFVDAIVISGLLGQEVGDNTGATMEPGEPTMVLTTVGYAVPVGSSVWYQWTATVSGEVTLDTIGSGFDTVLAVYLGSSVDSLTPIAGDDDTGGGRTSSLTFTAVMGATYSISVNGYGDGDFGPFVLNWNGQGSSTSGQFRFTSASYNYSMRESMSPQDNRGYMTYTPARATVTRVKGFTGMVQVGYMFTNTYYTNIFTTNYFGTNILSSVIDSNNVVIGFTNSFSTNVTVALDYQNFQAGRFFYSSIFLDGSSSMFTDENHNVSGSVSNVVLTELNDCVGSFYNTPFTNRIVDAASSTTNLVVTTVFCTNYVSTNLVPTASFVSSLPRTLVFDDYQMKQDIPIPLYNTNMSTTTPMRTFADVNQLVVVVLTSAQLDPLEDQSLPLPSVDLVRDTAYVTFLNNDIVPGTYGLNPTTNSVFNFERATIRCTEYVVGSHLARVAVIRTGTNLNAGASVNYRTDFGNGSGTYNYFPLQVGSDYATPSDAAAYSANVDFTAVSGTLNFPGSPAPGYDTQFIDIPIMDDDIVEFNEDILIQLDRDSASADTKVGNVSTCNLTILADSFLSYNLSTGIWTSGEQPAGAVDRSYNPDNSSFHTPPNPVHNLLPGANNSVYAVAMQADGKALIGGDFNAYNGISRSRIARVNSNGELDTTFDPGSGANNFVNAIALDSSGRAIVVGGFDSFNGNDHRKILRLNVNGSVDNSFDVGLGANGAILSAVIQADGKIVIGGEFTAINGTNRAYVARLNPDGGLDTTFDPGAGFYNGVDGGGMDNPIVVNAVGVQSDGKVLIGGEFISVDGSSRNHIARLNSDGPLDYSFDPGFGADGVVYALAVQSDDRVILGGSFNQVGLLGGAGLARLNGDGTVDTAFDVGSGADGAVYTIGLQADGKILVGGTFRSINQTRRVSFARLYANGAVDTTFMDTAYNQFAGLPNSYFNPDMDDPKPVYATAVQADGNIIIGGRFQQVGGGYLRDDIRPRQNLARLVGGGTPGPGVIELAQSSYTADSGVSQYFVTLTRTNGTLGPVGATMQALPLEPGPGAAVYGTDYLFTASTPMWGVSWDRPTWMLSDGLSGPNNAQVAINGTIFLGYNPVNVTIISNSNPNTTLNLVLTRPRGTDIFFLGGVARMSSSSYLTFSLATAEGENIPLGVALGRSLAPLTIVHNNNNTHPGELNFSSPTFTVNEDGTSAAITVTRSGGSDGTVTVRYATTTNGTARVGLDYTAASGTLTFRDGQTTKTFDIPIIDNTTAQPDRTVGLRIYTPSAGATLGSGTNAQLVIVDNDFAPGHVSFSVATNGINENAGPAIITVNRLGGSAGTLGVTVATVGGTAVNGINYTGFTNVLTWTNNDVAAKTISMPVFDDGLVTSNLTVNLQLRNGTVNGTNQSLVLGGIYTNFTLVITNTDSIGVVQFSAASYFFNENGGQAIIPVVRTGGSSQTISVNFTTLDATAYGGVDYVATNGTLVFSPGEVGKLIRVSMIDNGSGDPDRFLSLFLSGVTPTNALGSPSAAILNIVDDESANQPPGQPDTSYSTLAGFDGSIFALALQEDGSLLAGGDFTMADGVPRRRIARLKSDGTLDAKFSSYFSSYGANAAVHSIVIQSDKRILVGGFFTNFNNVVMKRIARLNFNGSLDSSFDPGSGANNPIYAMAETFVGGQRRIIVGGAFSLFNGATRNSIAQLLDNGSLDTGFIPSTGANGTVYAVAVQGDGKIIIGGDFTSVNGVAVSHVARLNTDGSLDATFVSGTGANGSVRAIAIQVDGRILIGGLFTSVNGTPLNHIARLNTTGSVDAGFTPGVGANDNVETIVVQPDARIIVGGDFTRCSGVTRNRITRLNPDGTVDPTINFGMGADSFVASALLQTDGSILLGGGFVTFDDKPHAHLVKVHGGSVTGSGSFEFVSQSYSTSELSSNIVVTVRRIGGTSGPNADGSGNLSVQFATSDGTAVAGVNYGTVITNLVFPPGEVSRTVDVPVYDDGVVTSELTVNLTLSNPTPPAGLGNQFSSTLHILNDDSTISFVLPVDSIAKNTPNGVATIGIIRRGSTSGAASVVFMTTTNGTAVLGTDYLAVSNLVVFNPGVVSNNVTVPIINNGLPEGNRTVIAILTNAATLVTNSANLLLVPPTQFALTIIDNVQAPGQVQFAATNLVVTEANSNVLVTVIRTNGTSGTIQVSCRTVAGTATPGLNYTATTSTLTFGGGETVKTFTLPILENSVVQGPVNLTLELFNATNGASIQGSATLPVTILDNDTGIAFSSPAYVVSETNGSVTLNVLRLNGSSGTVQVNYATTNGTALAGTNFTAVSGTLTFNPGETNKSVVVPLLHDFRATSNLTFAVNLSNPSPGAQLTFPSSATVMVLDAEAGLSFIRPTFTVLKSGTNAVLAVQCSNPNVEPVSVNFSTADGTAVSGVDYSAVSGTLNFTNGAVTNYIVVPIINNSLVEGDRTFTVTLFSPTAPGQLVEPYQATVTIVDINAGFSFSSPNYTVFNSGVQASIAVIRSGYTNSTASVDYATQNGSAINGVDYSAVSGTLTFTNGQTSRTILVSVTDFTVVQPDKTVLLQLSNPVGTNGVLVAPSAAVLTIRDNSGSLVIPAGSALLTESGPVNGVIDPGENVTLLFALRNSGGTNTVNLVATLLATNGVTSPSTNQNYGALVVNGPSASRQFSFIASGSNGQPVAATFRLTDGAVNVGTATFTFMLGSTSLTFSNNVAITIPDQGAATPYPSTLNVSGVGGSLTKATVTLNKIKHTYPADMNVLLVSPAGQRVVLMGNAGANFAVNNTTLTFDDDVAGYLPQNGQIVTGTNKPTTYNTVGNLPAPAPATPYATTLAAFTGSNPNGVWSLYVYDDSNINSGVISNGWSMKLTTISQIGAYSDLVAGISATPNPVIRSNTLTYTLTVTNFGPSIATGVSLSDTLPSNVRLVSSNAAQGSVSVVGNQVTWAVGSLAIDTGSALALEVMPTATGTITNTCSVVADGTDPNLANNSATVLTTVDSIKADLMLSLVDAPDPLWNGNNVTYTITITNAGPARAGGISVTNFLPPSVSVVSAGPGSYFVSGSTLVFPNLGSLAAGTLTNVTIVVKTTSAGTLTNTALVTSLVLDPLKGNNFATVKTVVNALQLGALKSGTALVISWPTNTSGYVLESATNLNPPVVWQSVGSPAPVVVGGQFVITNTIGSGSKFFRLRAP